MEDKVPDDRGGDEAREGQYVWDGVNILVGCELGQDLEERFFGCWRDWSGTWDSQSASKRHKKGGGKGVNSSRDGADRRVCWKRWWSNTFALCLAVLMSSTEFCCSGQPSVFVYHISDCQRSWDQGMNCIHVL
jgi:hypothetical protein